MRQKKDRLNSSKGLLVLAVTLNPTELSTTSTERERKAADRKEAESSIIAATQISLLALKSPGTATSPPPSVFSAVFRWENGHARRDACIRVTSRHA